MKIHHILFMALSFLVLSSAAQNTKADKIKAKQLYSQWNFVSASGGITGMGPGWDIAQSYMVTFKKNGTYTFLENNVVKQKDKFKIVEQKSQLSGEKTLIIDYKNNTDQSFIISGDTLWLQEDVHDGFGYRYLRKK